MDTFLFDLDGTLLPVDMNDFIRIYFKEVYFAFEDLVSREKLNQSIWMSVQAVIKNKGKNTNEEVFMDNFCRLMNCSREDFIERFNTFYEKGFVKIKESVSDIPLIKESVKILKNKGYHIIIATNPIFPRKVVYKRIEWAGLNPEDFIYISSYENSHFCKPNLKFYEEILDKNNKSPKQCIMVGNDVEEDMAASDLGMDTYLITNFLIHRNPGKINCTYMGSYEDFYLFVKSVPQT